MLTSYTYDQLNHLLQVTMPRSTGTQYRIFTYDSTTQRLTSAKNPETNNLAVSYTYNADGTLATKKDANGNTLTYTYDTYGRLTSSPAGTFVYDTCPAQDNYCTNAPGQLVEATFGSMVGPNDLTFQYDYTYTPAGKVSSKTLTLTSANQLGFGGVHAWGSLTASYTYDSQGALTAMAYPLCQSWQICTPPTFTYTLDALERPTTLTGNDNITYVSGVTYNAAGQTSYGGRTYYNLLQVTQAGAITYSYSPGNNNGQIVSSGDTVTGETISYTYDALKRLTDAHSSLNWEEQYGYDGFGNLTQMTPKQGSGPTLSVNVDPATNRISPTGVLYDNNGNTAYTPSMTLYDDTLNRLNRLSINTGANAYYGYDPSNLRVYYRDPSNTEWIYFYGVDGKKLAVFQIAGFPTEYGARVIQFTQQTRNLYFTGILVGQTDRLGSVTVNNRRYYLYGVEYTATSNDTEKYATYTRDSVSGLDYAVNRYYSSIWGRFLSPDPSPASVNLRNPQSWNRYAYVGNDPANGSDPSGLYDSPPGGPPTSPPAGGMDPFGPDGSSPCQSYRQALFNWRGLDGNVQNGDWAGFISALAECNGFFAGGGGAAGGGGTPWYQQHPCDTRDAKNAAIIGFMKSEQADAHSVAARTGLSTDFILAWASYESNWGNSTVAKDDNNFFGLKPDLGKPAHWAGSDPYSGCAVPGYDCFTSQPAGLVPSAVSALISFGGKYLNAALSRSVSGGRRNGDCASDRQRGVQQ